MARKSRYPLQMPAELHEKIKAAAAEADVSVNEFIVRVLSERFANDLGRRIAELERRLVELENRP